MKNTAYSLLILIILLTCISCSSEPSESPSEKAPDTPQQVGLEQDLPDISQDEEVINLKIRIKENESDPTAYYDLSKRYLELGRPDLARNQISKAIELDVDNLDYKITLANTFADEGKISRAEELFTEVREKDPENTDALVSWGVMYYQIGMILQDNEKINLAEEKYLEVLKIDPNNIKALYNLGLLYSMGDNIPKAREMFSKTHELEPDRFPVIQHLANLAMRAQDWEECRRYSLMGLEINEDPELVYYLGCVAFELEEYDEAQKQLEKFLSMNYFGPFESDARAKLLEIKGIGR